MQGTQNASKAETVDEQSVQPLFEKSNLELTAEAVTGCVLDEPEIKHAVEREQKAKASKTNAGAVQRGDLLEKKRPDLAEQVRKGEMKPAEAHRQMKRDEVYFFTSDDLTQPRV